MAVCYGSGTRGASNHKGVEPKEAECKDGKRRLYQDYILSMQQKVMLVSSKDYFMVLSNLTLPVYGEKVHDNLRHIMR